MCQEKSFPEAIYSNCLNNEYKYVIKTFEDLKNNESIEYVSIDYFFIFKKFDKNKIYELFHIMLEYKLIKKIDLVECNSCGNELIYQNNKINTCNICKETIYYDNIVEKFKLLYKENL